MAKSERFGIAYIPAPTKCPDCGATLGAAKHGRELDAQYKTVSPHYADSGVWYKECQCGCGIQWSYPQRWIRRHRLPLFDMHRAVVQDHEGVKHG